MKYLLLVYLLSNLSIFAMQQQQGVDFDLYTKQMFIVHFDRMADTKNLDIEDRENGLLKASKIIQQKLASTDINTFFAQFDGMLKDKTWEKIKNNEQYKDALQEAETKTKDIASLSQYDSQKIQEAHNAWLRFRRIAANLKIAELEKAGILKSIEYREGESPKEHIKRFYDANKDFDYKNEETMNIYLGCEVGTYEQVQIQRNRMKDLIPAEFQEQVKKIIPELSDVYDINYKPHK